VKVVCVILQTVLVHIPLETFYLQVEIMVPGPKVGLIIGKGGETIKQLQEKSGAKMVVIQDGPSQENEKPLRITGEPQKVEVRFIFYMAYRSDIF
jgi:predicted PilT family ATPase